MAFYWDDRGTRDIDVAYPDELPDDILESAFHIADERGLPLDWINTDITTLDRPQEKLFSKNVYKGNRFHVYVPHKKTLLAMKIYAGRWKDVSDAVRLAKDIGVTEQKPIEKMLRSCYSPQVVANTGHKDNFIELIVSLLDKTEDELETLLSPMQRNKPDLRSV